MFGLWLVATGLNLFKPFHIDDTFHLEAAKWIERNPFRPMSGIITWNNDAEYIYQYNQPPLYFYLIATIGHFFGYGELQLHLFQSVFTGLAIFVFFKLANLIISPRKALLLTVLFAINPAFLINQNIMVDVPLLSLHLLFVYILLRSGISNEIVRYLLAAFILSIALLIKYTSLPLLILLLLVPILKGQLKYAWFILLPVCILAGWSLCNYMEYGGKHILNRKVHEHTFRDLIRQPLVFTLCLGSIATFVLALVPGKKKTEIVSIAGSAAILILVIVAAIITDKQNVVQWSLWLLFGLNGVMILVFTFRKLIWVSAQYYLKREGLNEFILVLWFLLLVGFIVFFSPFMATRHVLLCLPPLMLLCAENLKRIRLSAVSIAFFIGLGLAVSDVAYAKVYQTQAAVLRKQLPAKAKVWTAGNWGWQWYSKKAGMIQLDSLSQSELKAGDYYVVPSNISRQQVAPKLKLIEVRQQVVPGSMATYFYTANYASMYISNFRKTPWTLSDAPIDTFTIYRVQP
mgnify:CR=1 FL=1